LGKLGKWAGLEVRHGLPTPQKGKGILLVSQDEIRILLQEGISAAKAGNKALAYSLLQQATELAPENELAWLWLAGVAPNPDEAVSFLKRVLEINPANERARAGLEWARAKGARLFISPSPQEEERGASWECPICLSKSVNSVDSCPKCGAVLSLKDVDALLNNSEADRRSVFQAIDRYTKELGEGSDFNTHFNLGLAYLNAQQMDKGISHLNIACRLSPNGRTLQDQVENLLKRQRGTPEVLEGEEAGKTVLIVDDSPTVCKLVSITLERHGHRVIVASDGMEALARLNDELPNVILLDITMPRMDGYQLCKTIKGNDETKNIPVIMLSGKDGLIDKVRGRMVGSIDYITKPFEPEQLLMLVEEHAEV
jgi:twitching motility two-component system response regulator PilG